MEENKNKIKTKNKAEEKILNFFSSLADRTRLNIIVSIAEKPRTVTEIYEIVGKKNLTLSAISHQLRYMTALNIVKAERKGKEKFYSLSENFCWCILKDAFKQFGKKIKINCKKCGIK